MKILITGASGFIGRNLLLGLPQSHRVTAQYFRSTDFLTFLQTQNLRDAEAVQADLSGDDGVQRLESCSRVFDCCIFLAANGDPAVSSARPAFDMVSNALTLVKLLERIQVEKFIYFSSGAVYDGLRGPVTPASPIAPRLPYAISKMASEHYLKHFQQQGQIGQAVAVRFFGAYGPYEPARKIYTRLVRQFGLLRDPRFAIRGDGSNLIDAMYISDAVRAIIALIDGTRGNVTLDLFSGRPLTLTQLVQEAAAAFALQPEIRYEGHVPEYIEFYSTDETQKAYGFKPSVKLQTGLRQLLTHLQETDSK